MEHADFTFSLVRQKAMAHCFPTEKAAEEWASGIRESRVRGYCCGNTLMGWIVMVGPWLWAFQIKHKSDGTFLSH